MKKTRLKGICTTDNNIIWYYLCLVVSGFSHKMGHRRYTTGRKRNVAVIFLLNHFRCWWQNMNVWMTIKLVKILLHKQIKVRVGREYVVYYVIVWYVFSFDIYLDICYPSLGYKPQLSVLNSSPLPLFICICWRLLFYSNYFYCHFIWHRFIILMPQSDSGV